MEKMNETAKTNGEANSNSATNSSGQSQYRATRIVSKHSNITKIKLFYINILFF